MGEYKSNCNVNAFWGRNYTANSGIKGKQHFQKQIPLKYKGIDLLSVRITWGAPM